MTIKKIRCQHNFGCLVDYEGKVNLMGDSYLAKKTGLFVSVIAQPFARM